MPIFKSKLELLIADVKKLDEKAKKLSPEEYEAFKKEVDAIYNKVDEVADEAKEQVANEEVHAEEHPVDNPPEGDSAPEVKEEEPEGESTPEEPAPEEPEPEEYNVKKEITELKEVVHAQAMKIEALEDKLAKYEGFGEGERGDDEHKDALVKTGKHSSELMHKYFGN